VLYFWSTLKTKAKNIHMKLQGFIFGLSFLLLFVSVLEYTDISFFLETLSTVSKAAASLRMPLQDVQLVPHNFSLGRGVLPSLAERAEQSCQRGYFQFGM
jgi:hypothetical protein